MLASDRQTCNGTYSSDVCMNVISLRGCILVHAIVSVRRFQSHHST